MLNFIYLYSNLKINYILSVHLRINGHFAEFMVNVSDGIWSVYEKGNVYDLKVLFKFPNNNYRGNNAIFLEFTTHLG